MSLCRMSRFFRLVFSVTLGLTALSRAPLHAASSLTDYLQALGYIAVPFDSSDASGFFHLDATVNGRSR